jgi:hypothetical protein
MTYFLFKRCQISENRYFWLVSFLLAIGIFVERYCFIVIVYKVKWYGYVLIVVVIIINMLFTLCKWKINKSIRLKQEQNAPIVKRMYE